MTMRPTLSVFVLLLATACNQRSEGKAAMPPAVGSGAVPLPELSLPRSGDAINAGAATPTEGHATGSLFPKAEAQLAPNASGVISKITVQEGDRVKKGQVVVQLDARDASLRLQQARAALEAAQVGLRGVKVEYDRTKSLFEQNAIAQAVWDQVQTRYDAAKVGVQQAQVAVSMAAKMSTDTTLRSPIDGVVTAKLKNVGEMVTMMPPTIVIVIQDQSSLELRFRVPEQELPSLEVGKEVSARIGGVDVRRSAKIHRVNPTIDPRTRTLEVVAVIDNTDGALRPGMLVEVNYGNTIRAGSASEPAPEATSPKSPTSVPAPATAPEPAMGSAATSATKAVAGETEKQP